VFSPLLRREQFNVTAPLGHVSLNTTSLYLHTEDDARHTETVKRHRMNWGASETQDDDSGNA
jgi:hypothetical protein